MFLAHNRLAYVKASLAALVENTDWSLVHRLWLVDDNSTDGTADYLLACKGAIGYRASFLPGEYGGPVAAMNAVLDRTKADILGKVDSDLVLPPGWLGTMLDVMQADARLDALGTEPGFAHPVQPDYVKRGYKPAAHVGGQGLFRTRAFAKQRPTQTGTFFGLTHFQRRYMTCGWVDPSIASFNLDHLPFEPWRSLAAEYVTKGWSRTWTTYAPAMSEYWSWWSDQQAAVA